MFTLEIACEGEAFYDENGEYAPWREIEVILAQVRKHSDTLVDSKNNTVGYTFMHEI